MLTVKVLWAVLWIAPQALAHDSCAGQSFGSRAVDPKDSRSYILCLGFLGQIKNTCNDGHLFDAQSQGCVADLQEIHKTHKEEQKVEAKKEVNIKQKISVDRPVIFNIFGNLNFFGSLWGYSQEPTTSGPPYSNALLTKFSLKSSPDQVESSPVDVSSLFHKELYALGDTSSSAIHPGILSTEFPSDSSSERPSSTEPGPESSTPENGLDSKSPLTTEEQQEGITSSSESPLSPEASTEAAEGSTSISTQDSEPSSENPLSTEGSLEDISSSSENPLSTSAAEDSPSTESPSESSTQETDLSSENPLTTEASPEDISSSSEDPLSTSPAQDSSSTESPSESSTQESDSSSENPLTTEAPWEDSSTESPSESSTQESESSSENPLTTEPSLEDSSSTESASESSTQESDSSSENPLTTDASLEDSSSTESPSESSTEESDSSSENPLTTDASLEDSSSTESPSESSTQETDSSSENPLTTEASAEKSSSTEENEVSTESTSPTEPEPGSSTESPNYSSEIQSSTEPSLDSSTLEPPSESSTEENISSTEISPESSSSTEPSQSTEIQSSTESSPESSTEAISSTEISPSESTTENINSSSETPAVTYPIQSSTEESVSSTESSDASTGTTDNSWGSGNGGSDHRSSTEPSHQSTTEGNASSSENPLTTEPTVESTTEENVSSSANPPTEIPCTTVPPPENSTEISGNPLTSEPPQYTTEKDGGSGNDDSENGGPSTEPSPQSSTEPTFESTTVENVSDNPNPPTEIPCTTVTSPENSTEIPGNPSTSEPSQDTTENDGGSGNGGSENGGPGSGTSTTQPTSQGTTEGITASSDHPTTIPCITVAPQNPSILEPSRRLQKEPAGLSAKSKDNSNGHQVERTVCSGFPNGVFLRDPKSCNKYYICLNEKPIPGKCPSNLSFDIRRKVCNFPKLVDCSVNEDPEAPVSTEAPSSAGLSSSTSINSAKRIRSTTQAPPSDNPTKKGFSVSVSQNGLKKKSVGLSEKTKENSPGRQEERTDCSDLPDGIFLRDSKSCNKFYVCLNGKPISGQCPRNLNFDIRRKVCNFPSLVDCSVNETPEAKTPNKDLKDGSLLACKSARNGAYIRDPNSCSKFYVCANGRALSRQCPRGLYFDFKLKFCNYPTLVQCAAEETPVDNPEPLIGVGIPDCGKSEEGKAFSDIKQHNKYYVCLKEIAVLHYCSPGQWFDHQSQKCTDQRLAKET